MSGKVPPSSRARTRAAAVDLYQQFTGMNPESISRVDVRLPQSALVIGNLVAVMYETVRDGKVERYKHTFRARSRPLLAASSDGKSLLILGGGFQFTDRGIVDK